MALWGYIKHIKKIIFLRQAYLIQKPVEECTTIGALNCLNMSGNNTFVKYVAHIPKRLLWLLITSCIPIALWI